MFDNKEVDSMLEVLVAPSQRTIKGIGAKVEQHYAIEDSIKYLCLQIDSFIMKNREFNALIAHLYLIDYLLFGLNEGRGTYECLTRHYQKSHLAFLLEVCAQKPDVPDTIQRSIKKLDAKWSKYKVNWITTPEIKAESPVMMDITPSATEPSLSTNIQKLVDTLNQLKPSAAPPPALQKNPILTMDINKLSHALNTISRYIYPAAPQQTIAWNQPHNPPICQLCKCSISLQYSTQLNQYLCQDSILVCINNVTQVRHKYCNLHSTS